MKEFGYGKIASTLYFIMMIIGMVFNVQGWINTAIFMAITIMVYFIFQKFFYTPEHIKAQDYPDMLMKTIKDTFIIAIGFLIISVLITLSLSVAFYFISQTSAFGQLFNFNTLILSFLFVMLSLTVSNFLYYHLSYKKDVLLTEDLKELAVEKESMVMTTIPSEEKVQEDVDVKSTDETQKDT